MTMVEVSLLVFATYLLDELVEVVSINLNFVGLHALHQRLQSTGNMTAEYERSVPFSTENAALMRAGGAIHSRLDSVQVILVHKHLNRVRHSRLTQ